MLPQAFDPLGQRLRTPAERRVDGRFVSVPRLVAGHDPGEVGAQARHGAGEAAHVDANDRALFCPGQLFFTALHVGERLMLSLSPILRGMENKGKRPGSTGVCRPRQKVARLTPAAAAFRLHAIMMPREGSRSERDLRHSLDMKGRVRVAMMLASLPEDAMDLSTKLKITAVLAALAMAILWSLPVPSEVADRQPAEVSSAAKTP